VFEHRTARGSGGFGKLGADRDGEFRRGLTGSVQGTAFVSRSATTTERFKIGNASNMFSRHGLISVENGLGAV
jgi:hypothetical protein